MSSKSVSVKASHCSLALTKTCSHNWQRRQLIIATIHLANSPPGHFQKLQVVDLAILVLINALDHLVQLLIAQVVAEAHDYLPQLVGCYETVVVLVKRLGKFEDDNDYDYDDYEALSKTLKAFSISSSVVFFVNAV